MQLYEFDGMDFTYIERYIASDCPSHQHAFFELEMYFSGEGTFTVNDKQYTIRPGTCSFVLPMDVHSINVNTRIHVINLSFLSSVISDPTIFNALYQLSDYCAYFNSENFTFVQTLLSKINVLAKNNNGLAHKYILALLHCLINEFLLSMSKSTDKIDLPDIPRQILESLKYINANFASDITLSDVSERVGMSKNYFCDSFHKYIGKTYKQYITDLRLEYAAKLLSCNDMSITEIAYMVGFGTMSNFFSAFKKKYEISPKAYAKKFSEKSSTPPPKKIN